MCNNHIKVGDYKHLVRGDYHLLRVIKDHLTLSAPTRPAMVNVEKYIHQP